MKRKCLAVGVCLLGFFVWSCGGATEQPVSASVVSDEQAVPETPVEPEPVVTDGGVKEALPADSTPSDTEVAKPDVEPEGKTEKVDAAQAKSEETGFKGKGKEKAVIGSSKGRKGPTNFTHWKHQESGIKCYRCHHKGAGRKSCSKGSDCHKFKEINAPSSKTAYHKGCNPCHRKKKLPKGCDYCHQPKS